MSRLYIGGLPVDITERELEQEFVRFGTIRSIWLARKPPGFAFLEYDDMRDAEDAIRKVDGQHGWRVELSRGRGERRPPPRYEDRGYDRGGYDRGGGSRGSRGGGMRSEMTCYECGQVGHFAADCRARGSDGPRRGGREPRGDYRGSSYRDRSRSPYRSPRRDSRTPPPRRSASYGSPRRSPRPARSASPRRSPTP